MKKQQATFQLFDSHNTCTEQIENDISPSKLLYKAQQLSLKYHHVIVSINNSWEEYENGLRVSWSYPLGIVTKTI